MKKTKLEKGITLIALIIIIVILLILAVVSIGTVKDSGIIEHASNTSDTWKQAQANEKLLLAKYEKSFPKNWEILSDGTIKSQFTGETKKLGDIVENSVVLEATDGTKGIYTGTWTIIGVENGKLKLVTTENLKGNVLLGKYDPNVYEKDEEGNATTLKSEIQEICDKVGEGKSKLDLAKAIWSYQHAVETLNDYAKANTGIGSARSITIEDIETILDITKHEISSKTNNTDCGKEDSYSYNGTKRVFVDRQGKVVVVDSDYDGEVVLDNNYYYLDEEFTGWKLKDSLLKDLIMNGDYWFASPCMSGGANSVVFCIRRVYFGTIGATWLFNSNLDERNEELERNVRAVVLI